MPDYMTQEQFRRTDATVCPFCECTDIDYEDSGYDCGQYYQTMWCTSCEGCFSAYYNLDGYEIVEEPARRENAITTNNISEIIIKSEPDEAFEIRSSEYGGVFCNACSVLKAKAGIPDDAEVHVFRYVRGLICTECGEPL